MKPRKLIIEIDLNEVRTLKDHLELSFSLGDVLAQYEYVESNKDVSIFSGEGEDAKIVGTYKVMALRSVRSA